MLGNVPGTKDTPEIKSLPSESSVWWGRQKTNKESGFPGSSVGKESTCNAGDPCSFPGSGISLGRRDRLLTPVFMDFPGGSVGKESPCNAGDLVQSLGWEDPLEKGMATHSSVPAWKIP